MESAKNKAYGVTSGRNQTDASRSPLPGDSHRMHFILPATCVKCCPP